MTRTNADNPHAAHTAAVRRLLDSYREIPVGAPVRLAKTSSNLFRARQPVSGPGLRVGGLDRVLAVDRHAATVDVGGMCTYETLVAATLPHGLAPTVVPQLKTITVGGAVTGLGIESSSFRVGLVHESVLEMDVLTGSGEIVTATPTNRYADLFHGFPNSFGTLGYATRIRLAAGAGAGLRRAPPPALPLGRRTPANEPRTSSLPAFSTVSRWTTWTGWCSRPTRAT